MASPGQVLMIVGGGIAAYKACEVVRELRRGGHRVEVLLTEAGARFVTPLTFEALSGSRVYLEQFPGCTEGTIDHIELGRRASVVVLVPATADLLARMQAGMADDLALATLLALPRSIPVVVAPAMNQEMWTHPLTERNCRELKRLLPHWRFLDPVVKELACGEYGPGGLAEPAAIAAAVAAALA